MTSADDIEVNPARHDGAADESGDAERADAYRVKLDVFEGPLDLLLHLVRKHELDILDIPIGFVTQKYLEYLQLMSELTIDVASEYLVMAATLTYIKSRTLLPRDPAQDGEDDAENEEELDPRADLIRRLLEYQKYKEAADRLGGRSGPGRDMFERGSQSPDPDGPAPLAPVGVFKLFDAFSKLLKRTHREAEHQVLFERISLTDRIVQLTELLADRRRLRFEELFLHAPITKDTEAGQAPSRFELVITFLALLEMCKMRVARIAQDDPLGELMVELSAKRLDGDHVPVPTEIGDEEREGAEPDGAPMAGDLGEQNETEDSGMGEA